MTIDGFDVGAAKFALIFNDFFKEEIKMAEEKKCSLCKENSLISLGPVNLCMKCIFKIVFMFVKDQDSPEEKFKQLVMSETLRVINEDSKSIA